MLKRLKAMIAAADNLYRNMYNSWYNKVDDWLKRDKEIEAEEVSDIGQWMNMSLQDTSQH